MHKEIIRLGDTASTNDFLKTHPTPATDAMTVATADYQTAGRGQGRNSWESERGKNLLFSILTSPTAVPAASQFVLSMAGALALKAALDARCDGIALKWPNDIYWHDRKISGTLIETAVRGKTIARCIYGIGLNVNQREFHSDAPNPVSLLNITGKETPTDMLLDDILAQFDRYYSLATGGQHDRICREYNDALYRRGETHSYEDTTTGEQFMARITHVDPNGLLHLTDSQGAEREYTLKQVRFVIAKKSINEQ